MDFLNFFSMFELFLLWIFDFICNFFYVVCDVWDLICSVMLFHCPLSFKMLMYAYFQVKRRIYSEEIEGLTVEWLEATSTLVLNLCSYKRAFRRSGSGFYRKLAEFACVVSPCSLKVESCMVGESGKECNASHLNNDGIPSQHGDRISKSEIDPVVFPITVRLLSTIPVALHAVGGDDGPIDIGVRLFVSSYFG